MNASSEINVPQEYIDRLKKQYPSYANVPDQELAQKIVAKYPQYKTALGDIASPSQVPVAEPPASVSTPVALGRGVRSVARGIGTALAYPQKKVQELTGQGGGETTTKILNKFYDITHPKTGPALLDVPKLFTGKKTELYNEKEKQQQAELGPFIARQATDPLTYLGVPLVKGGKAVLGAARGLRKATAVVPEAEKAAEAISKGAAPAVKPRFRLSPEGLKPLNEEARAAQADSLGFPGKVAAEGGAMPPESLGDLKGASAPGKPPAVGLLQRTREFIDKKFKVNLPAHPQILKEAPESPVISITQARSVAMSNDMGQIEKQPWVKMFWEGGREGDFNTKFATWEKNGFADAPEDIKQVISYLQSKRVDEKWAAHYLGERSLVDEERYWPHISLQDMDNFIRISRVESGVVKGFRTTLGMFEKTRKYKTMEEGIAHGVEYADARRSLLVRLWNSSAMVNTAKYVEDLEKAGVISRKAIRGGVRVEGIPGEAEWFTRTRAEARYIAQQLKDPKMGGMAHVANALNSYVRLPNLINPFPHVIRNMGFKHMLAGGNPARVPFDAAEFFKGTSPLVQEFKTVMPFEETGRTSNTIYRELLGAVSHPRGEKILNALRYPQRMSSQAVFSKADPAMKFSLWKRYRKQGLSAQAAANHVQIDLIDYGTRSNWIDMWKAVPGNFFVPWRYGTLMALTKQAKYHYIRTAMVIGAVDFMREELYRRTGWWMHFPTDYVEGTVAQIRRHGVGGAVAALASTVLLGPGGTTYTIESLLRQLHSSNLQDVVKGMKNAFWGMTLLGDDITKSTSEFKAYLQDNDPKHITKIFQYAVLGLLVGAHKPTYEPARVLGESVFQGIPYTDQGAKTNMLKQKNKQATQDMKNKAANLKVLHEISQTFGGR